MSCSSTAARSRYMMPIVASLTRNGTTVTPCSMRMSPRGRCFSITEAAHRKRIDGRDDNSASVRRGKSEPGGERDAPKEEARACGHTRADPGHALPPTSTPVELRELFVDQRKAGPDVANSKRAKHVSLPHGRFVGAETLTQTLIEGG